MDCAGFLSLILIRIFSDELDQCRVQRPYAGHRALKKYNTNPVNCKNCKQKHLPSQSTEGTVQYRRLRYVPVVYDMILYRS